MRLEDVELGRFASVVNHHQGLLVRRLVGVGLHLHAAFVLSVMSNRLEPSS
jgi:hypothetical protein